MDARPDHTSKTFAYAALLAVSALLAMLPVSCTSALRSPFQLLGLAQQPATAGARAAREAVGGASHPRLSEAQSRRLEEQNDELQRQVLHLSATVATLEDRVAELTGLAEPLSGSGAKIIVASVLSIDSNPRRAGFVIGKGSMHGIRAGQWVAAGVPRDARPTDATGRELLTRQWLIGRVKEADLRLSRVQATTDADFHAVAQAARVLPDGVWQAAERKCVIDGRGDGTLRIREAWQDYLKDGFRFVAIPESAELPVSLAIGQIASSSPVDNAPMHFDLVVRPWRDFRDVGTVYVISTGQ